MGGDGDKTEAATPKKRSQARERGQVAKSIEISSMSVLLGVMIALHNGIAHGAGLVKTYFQTTLLQLDDPHLTSHIVMQLAGGLLLVVAETLAPILLTAMILGIVVNVAQTGPLWAPKALKLNFQKLNPLTGLKRFVSPNSLIDLFKSLYKIGLVSYIAWTTIKSSYPQLMLTTRMELTQGVIMAGELAYHLALRIVITMLVLAAIDYAYQRWSFEKSLRMSKEEIRQEFKNQEGNMGMKARIRARQRAMAKKRMMAEVPTADVIVTNPTHFAVALKYDSNKMNAPLVVAKGQDLIALKIRELGQQNDVPIVENPPLARALYKNGVIGREIPDDLYGAVAEILAFVYQINSRRYTRKS